METARDSSSCCSSECAELRSLELDAPISLSRARSRLLRSPRDEKRERTVRVVADIRREVGIHESISSEVI